MKTLLERIEHCAETDRKARMSKETNWRELDRRAGLPEGTISMLRSRLRKDPNAGTQTDTAIAIAGLFNVTLDWLLLGRGYPFPNEQPHIEASRLADLPSYPALERAAQRIVNLDASVWELVRNQSPPLPEHSPLALARYAQLIAEFATPEL